VETCCKADEASLLGGDRITGKWHPYPAIFRADDPAKLVEDFANWPSDPKSILRFTRRYGPLAPIFAGRKMFSFKLADWLRLQAEFRARWEEEMPRPKKFTSFMPGFKFGVEDGEFFHSHFYRLTYHAINLYRLLLLEFHLQNAERLRKCQRPDCPNPYFLANRQQQKYCSEPCAQWSQRQLKLDWWNKHGRAIRSAEASKAKQKPKKRK
jgi:hypothetical protein